MRGQSIWQCIFWGILSAFIGCAAAGSYPYHIMTDDCRCEKITVKDPRANVRYTFGAIYEVREGISTTIEVEIQNSDDDTLDLSRAHVKVHSRNVPYRYNDKFVPIDIPVVLPGENRKITLVGQVELHNEDPWLRIAGEELVVTLKGLRIGLANLKVQEIHFKPLNPKIGV